jgi:hypothetical protein
LPAATDQFGFVRNRFSHNDEYSHRRRKSFTACSSRCYRL